MQIVTPPDFFRVLSGKHLLLDTTVFIDASLNPTQFGRLFNSLRDAEITIVSLDAVKAEFLKGAIDLTKYREKERFFDQIIEACLPVTPDIVTNVYSLIKKYKGDGKSLSFTDLLLGATLMLYRNNLFLLTKNTTEYPTTIFKLVTFFNVSYRKGLHSYGVYSVI